MPCNPTAPGPLLLTLAHRILTNTPLSSFPHTCLQGSKNSSTFGGKSKSPAKGSKNPSAPIVKPTAAPKKSTYDDDDYGYGDSDKPEMLEGWVEKKGGGRVKMGSDWQRR